MATEITARGKTGYLASVPDRAADLPARHRTKADPTLLGYRRFLEFNTTDACRTRFGVPTFSAISARMWFQKRGKTIAKVKRATDKEVRAEYFLTFEGCCDLLNLDAEAERTSRIGRIEEAWKQAAVRAASEETNRRRNYLLSCIGLPALSNDQYVLGLISADEYDEIAGVERPDPPERKKQSVSQPKPRTRSASVSSRGTGAPAATA